MHWILPQGSYSELLANKGDFADFLLEYMVGDDETDELGDIVGDLQQVVGEDEEKMRKLSRQGQSHFTLFNTRSVQRSAQPTVL